MSASPRPRKILLGMIEVSGYWSRMHEGLEAIGEDVTLLCTDTHPYGYSGSSRSGWAVRALQRSRSGKRSIASRVVEITLRSVLLIRYAATHDVFIFGYRTSFFNTRDLWLLRRLGKTVVIVFHGSDERPPYMDGYLGAVPDDELVSRSRAQKRLVDRCHKHAHLVVSNPNSGQFQQGRCLTYHVLGNPVSTKVTPTPARTGSAADRTIRILHAPSNPEAKGSAVIRDACRDLAASGLDIELDEVEGVSNVELHRRILESDLVVDQAFGDCAWAMLAAEASLLGRPAVIGGYCYDQAQVHRYLPDGYVPPTAWCEPTELGETIRRLATDEGSRLALGAAAREFAESMWNPQSVARRLMLAIDGTAPEDWFFEAGGIDYPWGGGITRDQVRRRVRSTVLAGGRSALCVDDKPMLLERLLREAGY